MCTVLLPPGGNPTAVNKYIDIISCVKINEINESDACSVMLCCVVRVYWGRLQVQAVMWKAKSKKAKKQNLKIIRNIAYSGR
jgi:hypothetical protein